ncbi:hypothetical protein ACFLVH_05935 [Chloroflexota bacterium]
MYKKHEVFDTPEDSRKIWRYMDFTKFLDILDKLKLYFPRADKLGDPFEGSLPKSSIEERTSTLEETYRPEFFKYIVPKEQAPKALSRATKSFRKFYAISCWSMSEEESAALWQLHLSGQDGVAIQTTVGRLKNSFERETRDIYIGEVKYINYVRDSIPINNALYPFLFKRASFKHERELRAVIFSPNFIVEGGSLRRISYPEGYYAQIAPDILIENVFVSPVTPKWQNELVQSVLSKYGLKTKISKVHQSDLSLKRKPLF